MNHHRIIGNIGRDPETRFLPDGTEILKFSVATSNDYFDQKTQQWVKRPADWHNVVCFGKLANSNSHLAKGDKVQVEGSSKTRTWDKEDGSKGNATELHAKSIHKMVMPEAAAQNNQADNTQNNGGYGYDYGH